jgi:hypothetical protein
MYQNQATSSHNTRVGFCVFTFIFLLWAGSAPASIGRTQSFHIGATNQIDWAGGVGSAQGENQGSFTQTQQASDRSLSVQQTGRGSLTQTATASGHGPSMARQTARIEGTQDLSAENSRHPTNGAHQDLGVKLDTRLFRPSGVGSVSGTQNYTGAQQQTLTSPCGTSSQSQSVDVTQSGSITTRTHTDPTVRNTINIDLHQSQLVHGQ